MKESDLLARFVGAFGKFYELAEYSHIYPMVAELAVRVPDEDGYTHWQPQRVETDRLCVDALYSKLPARFPPLYERLVLSYRWAEVDLGAYTLLANPPGPDLSRLLREISKDHALWALLIPSGYVQFAKGPDYDYDPVCFDLRTRDRNGDYRVVKIDHEEILCNSRIRVVTELASSFEELVRQTISKAGAG